MTKPTPIADGAVFDLVIADREMRSEPAYKNDGHTARTLVREAAIRVVLIAMRTGAKIAQHRSQQSASIHAVTGHVRLALPDRVVDLPAGSLLVLAPGVAHDVEAVGDSALLLTLARAEQE